MSKIIEFKNKVPKNTPPVSREIEEAELIALFKPEPAYRKFLSVIGIILLAFFVPVMVGIILGNIR